MNSIGLIGLGVMGQNLVLNMSDHDYHVSVFNRTWEVTKEFCTTNKGKYIEGFEQIKEFVDSLQRPRKIIILVKAGDAVDAVLSEILPMLEEGDIVMDLGNSFYQDTEKRNKLFVEHRINFMGVGISGGEEGARHGASFMVGGNQESFLQIKNILEDCAASDFSGGKCVGYFGNGGAGHFVKMVHNGIEYVDMQLIADIYSVLKNSGYENKEISDIFENLNSGKTSSYLLEITVKILRKKDENGEDLINKILDETGQKGTGQWASEAALNMSVPAFSFADSVFSRYLSTKKTKRLELAKIYNPDKINEKIYHDVLESAYLAAKILSYAQGFEIIFEASSNYGWNVDLSECARVWQGGCIIRAKLLSKFNLALQNSELLLNSDIQEILKNNIEKLQNFVAYAANNLLFTPGFSSCYQYFSGYVTGNSSANLISAQRDFFGAHGYKRVDKEGDFHTVWG